MTDLEMTKLCAEAMGIKPLYSDGVLQQGSSSSILLPGKDCDGFHYRYDPLHDDAQATALVKKMGLCLKPYSDGCWTAIHYDESGEEDCAGVHQPTFNRAIVECVAAMTKAKQESGE